MCGYEDLLNDVYRSSVRVEEVAEGAALMLPSEMQLQALWFAGQMGRDFTAVDGRVVRVVQFGHWNHGAGPDFLHCAVELEGELYAGPIELDHDVLDWEVHGHADNAEFDAVVLHVVFSAGKVERFTRTSDHRAVAQVVIPENVLREALQVPLTVQASAHPGRCFQPLRNMHGGNVNALMMSAVKYRMSQKAKRRARVIDALGEDEWLWQAVAETLGYRPNRLPMMLLAQRLPIAELQKVGSAGEAIVFGAAGFLTVDVYDAASGDSRDYLRELWEEWWSVRGEYEPTPERRVSWKMSGSRPVNHPQRRLACLVKIAENWVDFRDATKTTAGLADFFAELKDDYWNHHYTLRSKRSERRLALMGKDRLQDLLINHLIPARLVEGDQRVWDHYLGLPAPAISEKVDKASVRLFGHDDRRKDYLRKAWHHQALLQIYQDFCLQDVSDCMKCPFPEQLAQWRG